jgi:CheY-like chemotaxis protein
MQAAVPQVDAWRPVPRSSRRWTPRWFRHSPAVAGRDLIICQFGYEVSEALNGEEGIAKARAERPDLILMDISIPIIDGWEATQVLKHDPLTRDIPIIALTAHALASDREKAMEVGCDGYLAKPCEPRAVVAEVQRFLGKDATQNAG